MKKCIRSKILITPTLAGISQLFTLCSAPPVEFNCFQAGNCSEPTLSDSKKCLKQRDYKISTVNVPNRDVVVLSIHGGKIELKTSSITKNLANLYNWNRYDFNGHATSACLEGMSQFKRLHITSTRFDEPQALAIVKSHPKSVSIHGYSSNRGYSDGIICVGGKNVAQRKAFINYIEAKKNDFGKYILKPIDATKAKSGETCRGLKGTSSQNIVNKNSNGMGLQLEFSKTMRKDLVNKSSINKKLRNIVYGAIADAMNN